MLALMVGSVPPLRRAQKILGASERVKGRNAKRVPRFTFYVLRFTFAKGLVNAEDQTWNKKDKGAQRRKIVERETTNGTNPYKLLYSEHRHARNVRRKT